MIGCASALGIALTLGPRVAHAADGSAKLAAHQACPSVEEEIIDLDLLVEGLKQSIAVGMVEKIRLKSEIRDLIARLKAFHAGARRFTTPSCSSSAIFY